MTCSTGTYIRALARDLAEEPGRSSVGSHSKVSRSHHCTSSNSRTNWRFAAKGRSGLSIRLMERLIFSGFAGARLSLWRYCGMDGQSWELSHRPSHLTTVAM